MKKIITAFIMFGTAALYNTAAAQEEKVKEQTEEVIIRKKGNAATDLVIEIKGDKITVNGKPLSEFKDENVTIKKGKIIIKDKDGMAFGFNGDDFMHDWEEKNKHLLEDVRVLGENAGKYKDLLNGWQEGNVSPRAFLGVTTSDDEEGARIDKITEGSAADKAGLKEGDIITKIDDKNIEGQSSLSEIIADYQPKDKVKVYYIRGGKEKNTKATLGETKNSMTFAFRSPNGKVRSFTMPRVPGTPPTPPMPPGQIWSGEDFNNLALGGDNLNRLHSINIFPRQQKLGLKIQDTEDGSGIKVLGTDKDSPAEKAGLQKDDIVTEIAGKKINNTDDAREQLQEVQDKSSYTIKATRNGAAMNFEVKIPKKLKTADL